MANMQNLRDQDVEKDNVNGAGSNNYHLNASEDSDTALRKIRTAGSISISPELFEKIYLSPKNRVSGDIRSTFANPTPLYALDSSGTFVQSCKLIQATDVSEASSCP